MLMFYNSAAFITRYECMIKLQLDKIDPLGSGRPRPQAGHHTYQYLCSPRAPPHILTKACVNRADSLLIALLIIMNYYRPGSLLVTL